MISSSALGGLTASELEEVHEHIRAVAREILGKAEGEVVAWSALVDAGWLGLELGEHLGGAGVGFTETGLILEEMGRAAVASSFLGSSVLSARALQLLAPSQLRDELLERLAGGTLRAAVVLPVSDDAIGGSRIPFALNRKNDQQLVIEGATPFIPDADEAEVLIVLATGVSGELLAVVMEPSSDGLTIRSQPVLDSTRSLAVVSADAVPIDEPSVLRFSNPGGALQDLLDRGAAAMACDSLGIIGAMLDRTVDYASARQQFGRPIGSFQAVKHACADMFVISQVANELLGLATAQLSEGRGNYSRAVSMAKSFVTEGAVQVAGKAIQLHGGIGYTWEAGLHIFQKRALLNRSLFGSPSAHRRRIAEWY